MISKYFAWLELHIVSSPEVVPFLVMIFTLKFYHFYRWMRFKFSEVSMLLLEDLRDPIIMAGFGGTLISIYLESLIKDPDIMRALSGALLSSVYAISCALAITFFRQKN